MKSSCWFVTLLLGLATASSAQTLRVATFDIEPFFYRDGGQPAGIDYEILEYFAKSKGLDLEIYWVDAFPDLFTMLEDDKGDVAAAAITITAERKTRVDFSTPYFPSQLRLIERQGDEIENLQSLAGAKVGVLAGSIGDKYFASVPNVKIQPYDGIRELYQALASAEVKAIASETANAFRLIQEYDSLRVGLPLKEPDQYGLAVQKGSTLRDELNTHLEKLRSSGIYFRLLEKYLGAMAAEVVRAGKN
jgi:polar amino acid transport system substrate-binding protein